jgi:hypothetical protein
MAFKEKINFDGLIASQKAGQKVAIYDKYMATSGYDLSDVTIYERNNKGEWEHLEDSNKLANWEHGISLDMYKGVLAIGSPRSTVSNLGRAVVASSLDDFVDEQNFTPDDSASSVVFGSSVSLSDSFFAVGDPGHNSNRGVVYIYVKTGDNWVGVTKEDYMVIPNDAIANQNFGTSVSINENFLIVGARGDSGSKGAVYIFERDSDTGAWEQSQKIIASDGQSGDEFGGEVSLSGDYFAVGAEFTDASDQEINVGAVYIFSYSNSWNELRKITGVGESGLIANNFGHSVDLQDDYLIVGSPGARNSGVADVFYKKRNWGHLKKIVSDSVSTGDSFGESVSIYHPYLAVGSPEIASGLGRFYIFEDPPIRLRLAQEFEVNEEFVPTKASVYLKRSGDNLSSSWALRSSRASIIDASNFSSISQSDNKVIFDDRVSGYTGNGYMVLSPEDEFDIVGGDDNSYPIVNYPIRNSIPDYYNLWIRCFSADFGDPSSSNFEADILLDGIVVKNISSVVGSDEWLWLNTSFILPDTQQHILGIRMKEKGAIIDKIYIDADSGTVPEGDGPPYLTSPYITAHMKVYDGYGYSSPVDPLYIYDYKTSLDEIIQDDWYNFDINVLDSRRGYDIKEDFTSNFFLVMSTSGSNSDNFILWEILEKDEYSSQNSAIKI